jgi:hypothetical protein
MALPANYHFSLALVARRAHAAVPAWRRFRALAEPTAAAMSSAPEAPTPAELRRLA